MPQNNFSKLVLEAVEEGLSSLGDSPKQAILFHLENSFKIDKNNIPTNLTEFEKALEKLFGPGASYLEQLIVKQLYKKLGLTVEDIGTCNFLEQINHAKKRLQPNGGE